MQRALQRVFARAQQSCVLDRNRGLIGQDLDEAQVVVIEVARGASKQADDAVDPIVSTHRHDEH